MVLNTVLPNAAKIAFTGTPLLKSELTTGEFGDYIDKYTIEQSVEDGATLQILYEGMEDLTNNFSSYGAHYIRFGLDYPHIYDLMFGNIDLDMSLYPDIEALHDAAFDEV